MSFTAEVLSAKDKLWADFLETKQDVNRTNWARFISKQDLTPNPNNAYENFVDKDGNYKNENGGWMKIPEMRDQLDCEGAQDDDYEESEPMQDLQANSPPSWDSMDRNSRASTTGGAIGRGAVAQGVCSRFNLMNTDGSERSAPGRTDGIPRSHPRESQEKS